MTIPVAIRVGSAPASTRSLPGELTVPDSPAGVVLFAHGSGSSRHSPRNLAVAQALQDAGFATLLFDLLTGAEDAPGEGGSAHRFDISLLSDRLLDAIAHVRSEQSVGHLRLGLFGASTGAAAALVAAARRPEDVAAVVSRGGRPDLAGDSLRRVRTPTLLIVGERDETVLTLNRDAGAELSAPYELQIVAGATHLFEEPGALEQVAELATGWFSRHLPGQQQPAR